MHSPAPNMEKRQFTICVFCGSSPGVKAEYAATAKRLGELIAANGYAMVFGAGNLGLMGETARAARDGGSPVTGILPAFLRHIEPPMQGGEELIVTPDMHQRKDRMETMSDAFVILPGGLGTMDELFEVLATAQLGVHKKPIILLDIANYFTPVLALMNHIVTEGFALAAIDKLYRIAATPEDAMRFLKEALLPSPLAENA
ncbi:MAG TPA: TIGR00730 family Rossman fold protein [Rhizomicrobium sp.]